jgi:methoxymalonate biosynthesis acyl carrier protein
MINKDELIEFIMEDAGLDRAEFNEDTLLFTDGYIDSFTLTSMIAFIEERAKIKIEPSSITTENFESIANIMRFLEQRNS